MNKIISKSVAMLLALCTVFGLFFNGSTQANAIEVSSDGYTIITTAAELESVRNNLSGKYRLGNDINLSKYSCNNSTWTSKKGWEPIGSSSSKAFTGVFDGAGYTISGLWSKDRGGNQGLFGFMSGATITNLNISTISCGIYTSGCNVGVLAGNAYSGTLIQNVKVEKSTISGCGQNVGGLVGYVNNSSIENSTVCSSSIYGSSTVGGMFGTVTKDSQLYKNCANKLSVTSLCGSAGGFVADISGSTATRCYVTNCTSVIGKCKVGGWAGIINNSTVEISCSYGTVSTLYCGTVAGGFAGYTACSKISNCYAQVNVSSMMGGGTGGFIGYGASGTTVENTYAAGKVTVAWCLSKTNTGAYSGYSNITFTGTNYYDCSINCNLSSSGTSGKCSGSPQGYKTATMKKQATFVGWDFETIWAIKENVTYPYFSNMDCSVDPVDPVEPEISQPPVISEIHEGDRVVTGTGIDGATVTVTVPGGTEISVTVNSDSTWSINVPNEEYLYEGSVVSAVQKETDKEVSERVYETVLGNTMFIPGFDISYENLTTEGADYALPGDEIRYEITVYNEGGTDSVWPDAGIVIGFGDLFNYDDSNPIYIDDVIATVGTDPGQYIHDSLENTLTVYLGDLVYMDQKEVKLVLIVRNDLESTITDLNLYISTIA